MNFLLVFVVLAAVVVGALGGAHKGKFPACNTLKAVKIDYQKLIELSPFNIYQTNVELFDQSKIVFTGTQPSKPKYSGSSIILQGPKVFTYDITMIQQSTFSTLACSTGVLANYTTVYSNLNTVDQSGFCVVTCDKNGVDYTNIVCIGKTQKDYSNFVKYLCKNLPGVPGIFNGQENVAKPKTCNFFLN